MFRVCSECAQSMLRVSSECLQSVFRVCSECHQSVIRVSSECYQSVFRVSSECVQGVFSVCLECVQSVFNIEVTSSSSASSVSFFGILVMFAIFGQGLEGIFGAKLVQNFNPSALHVSMSSTSNTTYVINIDLLAICILLYCKQ